MVLGLQHQFRHPSIGLASRQRYRGTLYLYEGLLWGKFYPNSCPQNALWPVAARTWKVCRDATCFPWDRVGQSIVVRTGVALKLLNTEVLVGVPNSGNASLAKATYLQQKRKDKSALEKPQLFECVLCSLLRGQTHPGKEYSDTQCAVHWGDWASDPRHTGKMRCPPQQWTGDGCPIWKPGKADVTFLYLFWSGINLSVLRHLLSKVRPLAKVFRKLILRFVVHEDSMWVLQLWGYP